MAGINDGHSHNLREEASNPSEGITTPTPSETNKPRGAPALPGHEANSDAAVP
jgi:hypothetical protein